MLSNRNFSTKSRDIAPFLSIKTFGTRIILKHRNVPHRNFWVQWDEKFSKENNVIPVLCTNFYDTQIFLKQWRVPQEFFGNVTQKFLTENCDIPPPLVHKFFRYENISEKQNDSLANFFVSVPWDRKISTENRGILPLFFIHKNF